MPQSERVSLRFKFNWKISALTIFLLPVLVCLGFWQLQRAQEKRNLLAEYQQRWNVGPVDLDSFA
ncbi:MAG: SURF1 family cytochrome oxidase biogenesis protein [Exilibacterium sp.]